MAPRWRSPAAEGKAGVGPADRGGPRGTTWRGTWWVDAVAVGEVDDTPVAVTSDPDGVRVWDLRTGAPRRKPLLHEDIPFRDLLSLRDYSYEQSVRAVAMGEVDGTPVFRDALVGHVRVTLGGHHG